MIRSTLLSKARGRPRSSSKLDDTLPFGAMPGPRPLPLIGNIWRYIPLIGEYKIDDLFGNAKLNRIKYGPIVREQITKKHVVLHLFDPGDVEAFFRQDSNQPRRRSHRALLKLRHEKPDRYNDGGIFPENGTKWQRLRTIFNQSLMKADEVFKRAPTLDEVTCRSVDSIKYLPTTSNGCSQLDDFEQFLNRWSVRCALATFLDYSSSDLSDNRLLDQIIQCSDDQLDALAGTEIKTERWLERPERCPFYQKLTREEEFMYSFIGQRLEHLIETSSTNEISFIRDWLEDDRLDRKDIITFLIDSILANIHTTVYTCIHLLQDFATRMNVGQRDRLLAEISGFPSPSSNKPETSDITRSIPFLKDCLRETMRLHPVSIGTGRVTQHEMVLSNYKIPANVMVIAHNQVISCDPEIYERPLEYDPDRWAIYRTRQRQDRPSRFAWLPFGFGPRACIGQRLVSLQMYLFAIRLLQQFSIDFIEPIKTKTSLVHQIDGNVAVRLRSGLPE